jgi:formylglycine-generating enzyme required for sulfatase activity
VGVAFLILAVLGVTGRLNHLIFRPVDMEGYWVLVPAGEFQMGSSQEDIEYVRHLCSDCDFSREQPQHSVFLDEFHIGKYEVTERQYAQCVKARICRAVPDLGKGKELHPVVNVTWYDAKEFCEWLGGRLPTEAEWEKAASWDDQAKTKRIQPWGDAMNCSYANYYGKDGGSDYCAGNTTPVGSYESGKGPYGLYDMAGNVWEWVNDWYSDTYYQNSPSANPVGPDSGQVRVLRGGSWGNNGKDVRSAGRNWNYPTNAFNTVGFRCARSQ